MKIVRKEDLNLPDAPAQAPQIDWGKDFEEFDTGHKIRYLKKLCSALNHTADIIQKERNVALEDCHRLKKLAENAENSVSIQKAIVLKAITEHNEEKQNLISRLQELEKEIKEYKVIVKLLKEE